MITWFSGEQMKSSRAEKHNLSQAPTLLYLKLECNHDDQGNTIWYRQIDWSYETIFINSFVLKAYSIIFQLVPYVDGPTRGGEHRGYSDMFTFSNNHRTPMLSTGKTSFFPVCLYSHMLYFLSKNFSSLSIDLFPLYKFAHQFAPQYFYVYHVILFL